ncbi:DNA glycosylase [Cylindrobasidium torrendii FP15055 ss-10]|uniref:DNA glycosylase n=1 Tax=Cylindrobasidium torrendii FP15055 ss-10 TaxID=1314674 RepID=A0A0D7B7J3_9AGAR|nr:DNA glycosylase [Cylindrobasidium torrendii FP15055 ss-10]
MAKAKPPTSMQSKLPLTTQKAAKDKKLKAKSPVHDAAKPKKRKIIVRELAIPHPSPPKWEEVYALIQQHRADGGAPVDTMGCDLAGVGEDDPKDAACDAAVKRLRAVLGGSITLPALLEAPIELIRETIYPVSFYKSKAKYIKATVSALNEEFDGEVPRDVDDLCSLTGIGPKMAFLILQVAWKQNDGICVDTHVHRITNLLGWHSPPTNTPEQTRLNLQSWLPKSHWQDINHLLVGFGQTICPEPGRKCGSCNVNKAGLCPGALPPGAKTTTKKKRGSTKRKRKDDVEESEEGEDGAEYTQVKVVRNKRKATKKKTKKENIEDLEDLV